MHIYLYIQLTNIFINTIIGVGLWCVRIFNQSANKKKHCDTILSTERLGKAMVLVAPTLNCLDDYE